MQRAMLQLQHHVSAQLRKTQRLLMIRWWKRERKATTGPFGLGVMQLGMPGLQSLPMRRSRTPPQPQRTSSCPWQ